VGDFRGDGRLSVAIVTQDSGGSGASEVSIFPGNGNGTFASAIVSPTGPLASTVIAADFNGDGKLDLVTMEFRFADRIGNTANLAILLGNGDGSFKAPNEIIFEGETCPFALAAGDFNGDHQVDLAFVAAYFGGINAVGILTGRGDGTFVLSDPFFFTPGASPAGATIADLNGDGNLDVAVFEAGTIDVLLGQGDGTLGPSTQFGIGPGAASGLATDVNGDYEVDLVFASAGGLNVVLGNGNGTFGSKKTYPASNSPLGLVAGDFKEDGHLDLAFNNADAHTVSILPGTGNGSFPTSQSFATGGRGVSIVASDSSASLRVH
jgi:FG-GAP-like repeat